MNGESCSLLNNFTSFVKKEQTGHLPENIIVRPIQEVINAPLAGMSCLLLT
jgi:hypothetical protein